MATEHDLIIGLLKDMKSDVREDLRAVNTSVCQLHSTVARIDERLMVLEKRTPPRGVAPVRAKVDSSTAPDTQESRKVGSHAVAFAGGSGVLGLLWKLLEHFQHSGPPAP